MNVDSATKREVWRLFAQNAVTHPVHGYDQHIHSIQKCVTTLLTQNFVHISEMCHLASSTPLQWWRDVTSSVASKQARRQHRCVYNSN